MSESNDNALLLDYLHENLSRDQYETLFARLRREPGLVRRMLDLATDEELLREWAGGQAPDMNHSLAAEIDRTLDADHLNADQASLVVGNARGGSRRRRRIVFPAIAGLLLMAMLGVWWLSLPIAVARVDHAASATGLREGFGWRTIRAGGSLRFDAGVVELTLTNRASLVVEGPCECRFESAERVHLLSGRLYADVPESGHGLTIITPDGEIVDLGTRFGVEVQTGIGTEVHVFQGKVIAELSGGRAEKSHLLAGKAVSFDAKTKVVRNIPLSRKFARQAVPYVEHFLYPRGVLAGKSGWFDSGLLPRPILINRQNLDYPGLAGSTGAAITIGSQKGQLSSPVGRRWHDRYFSILIEPDDDFPKRQTLDPATLVSFGSLDEPNYSNVRLVTRKSNPLDRPSANYGLIVDGDSQFVESADFRGSHPCLVVMRLNDKQIDLWVNPPSTSLGRTAPEPDVTIQRSLQSPLEALWLNDAFNPEITQFYIDAIRGGSTWTEVTPRANAKP